MNDTAGICTLLDDAGWRQKTEAADRLAAPCRLCPRACGVNRLAGEKGFCRAPGHAVVCSAFPHFGEEPPISGTRGSGTVFFSYCTLRCPFCQNWRISHEGAGEPAAPDELAATFLRLQEQGCHNINLVTPDHFLPWVLRGLHAAAGAGLRIPVVYNCSGYQCADALDILDGVVDVYLPDMKYGGEEAARSLSGVADYVTVNRAAIMAMFRGVGPLKTDSDGVARRGLLIRHLVLPDGLAGSENVAAFLAGRFDPADMTVSVMAQYRPMHQARDHPEINRTVTAQEYREACGFFTAKELAGFIQQYESLDGAFCIDFDKRKNEPLTGR